MAAYRWKSVTWRGSGQPGTTGIAPAGLPAWVEARSRRGWRHLVAAAASGGHQVARTGPGDVGGRTWHAGRA